MTVAQEAMEKLEGLPQGHLRLFLTKYYSKFKYSTTDGNVEIVTRFSEWVISPLGPSAKWNQVLKDLNKFIEENSHSGRPQDDQPGSSPDTPAPDPSELQEPLKVDLPFESSLAENHYKAYLEALKNKKYDEALVEIQGAAAIDSRYRLWPNDNYRLVSILGSGGFGTAFVREHKYLRSTKAISRQHVLKSFDASKMDQKPEDIFREAKILHELTESESDDEGRLHIIRVLECGYASELAGRKINPYITMDYIPDGRTLESYVSENGPFQPNDFFPIARAIALALRCAHRNNVLHRDVHPANVLIKPEPNGQWTVRLIDFGLAAIRRIAEESRAHSSVSKIEFIDPVIGGRLGYAAPEQLEPKKWGKIGWHSDVYSFGRVIYFAFFSEPDPDDHEKKELETTWKTLLSKATTKNRQSGTKILMKSFWNSNNLRSIKSL